MIVSKVFEQPVYVYSTDVFVLYMLLNVYIFLDLKGQPGLCNDMQKHKW